ASTLVDIGRAARAAAVAEAGGEATRSLGLTLFEWFIAGNLASALTQLGRLEEAESLGRRILEEQRAALDRRESSTPEVPAPRRSRVSAATRRRVLSSTSCCRSRAGSAVPS